MIHQNYENLEDIEVMVHTTSVGQFTLRSRKSNPHPSGGFFSMARIVQVISDAKPFEITLDERHFNTIHNNDILNKRQQKVYDYIEILHDLMKAGSTSYGTYKNPKNASFRGYEGIECLYIHDFFDYIRRETRIGKLTTILT